MCFSAQASFFSAALLVSIGIATIYKARSTPSLRCFSLIPLLFALQQAAEGVIWIGGTESLLFAAQTLFLTIALIVWPIWIPLSIAQVETSPVRKAVLYLLVSTGVIWGVFALESIRSATTLIHSCHISYTLNSWTPLTTDQAIGLYGCLTLLPFFIAQNRSLKLFGVLVTYSYIISYLCWYAFFISVWCFFAALLSMTVYIIVSRYVKKGFERRIIDRGQKPLSPY